MGVHLKTLAERQAAMRFSLRLRREEKLRKAQEQAQQREEKYLARYAAISRARRAPVR